MMAFKIDTSFIGNYKIGDNISYNARIICDLYTATETIGIKRLYKPKVVFNVSLIDAAFYDFIRRIREHTLEFKFLSASVRRNIRATKPEKLRTFNEHLNKFRHYELLGKHPKLYANLSELILLRNRVHIQNEKGEFQRDDAAAFTKKRLEQSERCTEFTLKYLAKHYPRKIKAVADIELPWKEHFDEKLKW